MIDNIQFRITIGLFQPAGGKNIMSHCVKNKKSIIKGKVMKFGVATASLMLAPAEGLGAVCWTVSWSVNQLSLIIATISGINYERCVKICRVCEDFTRIT